MAGKVSRRKAAPVEEPEEVTEVDETDEDAFEELEDDDDTEDTSDDDDDLEELDESDDEPEEEPTPRKKAKKTAKAGSKTTAKPRSDTPQYSSTWLASHISEVTGQSYDARSTRILLRRLAKQENGPLSRNVGEERGRYSFDGPNDPAVLAILKMVQSGEAAAIKREGLDKVKKDAEAKKKAKTTVEEVEEEEVEEETPRRKTKKSTKAAPAKATATRRKAKA